jgi:hypothetical protein
LLTFILNSIVYLHQAISVYPQEATADVVAGGSADLHFNALNLSRIPRKMIIWVSKKESDVIGVNIAKFQKTDTSKH